MLSGDVDTVSKDFGSGFQQEIEEVDPVEEGGAVCRRERGDEYHEVPNEPLHLAVEYLKEDMDASRPRDEGFQVLKGTAPLASVHPGEEILTLFDELEREVELTGPDQAFIYTPVIFQSRVSGYGRPRRSFSLVMEELGHPSPSFLRSVMTGFIQHSTKSNILIFSHSFRVVHRWRFSLT